MTSQPQTKSVETFQEDTGQTEPYNGSFLDRFMGFVERLPIPYGVAYLALFILEGLLFHAMSWADGWLPEYEFSPLLLIFSLWLWGPLAVMTYLDRVSLDALASFSSLLDDRPGTMERLKREFITLPTRDVIINALIWSILYFIMTYLAFDAFYVENGMQTSNIVLSIIFGWFTFIIGSSIYPHSYRQLRLVNRTVKSVKRFNLFQLDPVYAFSRLTARTGVAWVILLSLTLLIFPIQFATVPYFGILILQMLLAIAAFILPIWIVHQRLISEKRRLQAELNQRLESALERLHRSFDADKLGEIDQLNSALVGLREERDILAKIPTWPWRAGTLTGFLSAVLLPIALFLIQLTLGNWLGG